MAGAGAVHRRDRNAREPRGKTWGRAGEQTGAYETGTGGACEIVAKVAVDYWGVEAVQVGYSCSTGGV